MKKLFFILFFISAVSSYAQLKITNNGNVGIGENNPTTKLQINGEGLVTSNIGAWGRSFWVKVNNRDACAYNLFSVPKQRDVFFVSEKGWLWTQKGGWFGSDSTLKTEIQKIEAPLENLLKLNGVQYKYKDEEKETGYRMGLIAQDVEEIFPGIIRTMPDDTKALAYDDLIGLIIEAMKEQQNQISILQNIVYRQEIDLVRLKNNYDVCCSSSSSSISFKNQEIDLMDTIINNNIDTTFGEDALLFENTPNPFTSNTDINFVLPQTYISAKIIIFNLMGTQLRSYDLTQHGKGSITISGSDLEAGMYLYSLLVDNKLIDTKRMLLTK
ncbi:MAG: tail fiber domain-containing protein [Bacteroidales bacterium]